MATRTDNPVTLSHEDADKIGRYLSEYADWSADRARKSKAQSAVVSLMRRDASEAKRLAEVIVRHLYTWSD